MLALVGGCETYDFTHRVGSLCAYPNEELAIRGAPGMPQTYRAREQVTFTFISDPPGCPPEQIAECDVVFGEHPLELVVHAYAAWNASPHMYCPRIVDSVSTQCSTPRLDADTYTVIYEDQRMLLRVPSTTSEAPCLQHY
jgi:hypothetical protein